MFGPSITIDSELSETSTNAIQNKAVYAALQSLTNEIVANEEVHAVAYNDLNTRLIAIEKALSSINQ
jgi:hypothetical protein